MSYSVSDAIDLIRDALANDFAVTLGVESKNGHLVRARASRRVPFDASDPRSGNVDVFAEVDNGRVELSVSAGSQTITGFHGQVSAEEAARVFLAFVDGTERYANVLRVFAKYGRRPTVHELKCWPKFFRPLYLGEKHFEFRKDDRGFAVGDVLKLREWDPRSSPFELVKDREEGAPPTDGEYTGRIEYRVVTFVLRAPDAGVPAGHCVMSLEKLP